MGPFKKYVTEKLVIYTPLHLLSRFIVGKNDAIFASRNGMCWYPPYPLTVTYFLNGPYP